MITSMTGFGSSVIEEGSTRIGIELKSVNHRFLDLTLNMPHPLMYLENQIKDCVRSHVRRGALSLYLSVEGSTSVSPTIHTNWDVVDQYVESAREMSRRIGADSWDYSRIMMLPGVFSIREADDEAAKKIEPLVLKAVELACLRLVDMRRIEGGKLREDLLEKVSAVEEHMAELKEEAPHVRQHYAERLRASVTDFLEKHTLDENRLMNEVAVFADKSAIDEELTRMDSHLSQFRTLLDLSSDSRPVGRQLDFLIQEMNREMNTIGSKGNSITISHQVVTIKSEIEKLREQVQNVE